MAIRSGSAAAHVILTIDGTEYEVPFVAPEGHDHAQHELVLMRVPETGERVVVKGNAIVVETEAGDRTIGTRKEAEDAAEQATRAADVREAEASHAGHKARLARERAEKERIADEQKLEKRMAAKKKTR